MWCEGHAGISRLYLCARNLFSCTRFSSKISYVPTYYYIRSRRECAHSGSWTRDTIWYYIMVILSVDVCAFLNSCVTVRPINHLPPPPCDYSKVTDSTGTTRLTTLRNYTSILVIIRAGTLCLINAVIVIAFYIVYTIHNRIFISWRNCFALACILKTLKCILF